MAKKFLDQTGLSYLWGKCVAAFAQKTHTHNYAGAGSSGGTALHSYNLYVRYIGDMPGKTIAQLRTALDTWLRENLNHMAVCRFKSADNWTTLWNANDTTTTLSAGKWWYVTKIGGHSDNLYCHLLISTNNDGIVFTVAKVNGTWQSLRKLANVDYVSENYAAKSHTHPVDSALSSTSTNPVQNNIVKAGIDAVSTDVESALDDLLGVGTVQALESLLG